MRDRSYYESLDKRTREYKEWAKRFENDNTIKAGDVVERITTATGIKKVVEWIAGEDCGCKERKEKLNEYSIKLNTCPTQEQYEYLKWFFEMRRKSNSVTSREQDKLNDILTHVTGVRHNRVSCCYGTRLNKLERIYNAYR